MEEIENGLIPWDFYHRREEKPHAKLENETPEHDVWTGETKIVVDVDEDGEAGFVLLTRSKFASNARWNRDVLDFYASCKHLFGATFPRNPCQFTHVIKDMAKHFAATHITGAKALGKTGCG